MYVLYLFRKMVGKTLLKAWTRNFCNCPIIWAAKSSSWATPSPSRTLPCTTSWNGTTLLMDISCQNVSWIQEFFPFLKWFHKNASFQMATSWNTLTVLNACPRSNPSWRVPSISRPFFRHSPNGVMVSTTQLLFKSSTLNVTHANLNPNF